MKKMLLSLALIIAGTICANAQFEQGKKYIGASLSNVSLNYSKAKDTSFGMNLNGGYFLDDEFLVKGELGYNYEGKTNAFNVGAVIISSATVSLWALAESCNGVSILVRAITERL